MSANQEVDPGPLGMVDALKEEFKTLRSTTDYTAATEKELFDKVHRQAEPFSALCISGGGIRSATFGLGVIQGLAGRGLLDKFDYLSTVSGGGYIGGWLSAWSKRKAGLAAVVERLKPGVKRPQPAPATDESVAPGAAPPIDPIQHLRDYNSYLTPKQGAMSADTWTLAATIVRNMMLNWMVLIPLLMAALMVPRLIMSVVVLPEVLFTGVIFPNGPDANYKAPALDALLAPWHADWIGLVSVLLFTFALLNLLRYLPGISGNDASEIATDTSLKGHSHGDYVWMVLVPLIGSVFAYMMYSAFYYLGSHYQGTSSLWHEILGRLFACVPAWIWYLFFSHHPLQKRLRLAVPLLAAFAVITIGTGAASWVTVNFLVGSPDPRADPSWSVYVTLTPPLMVLSVLTGIVLFLGMSSRLLADEDREWMSRSNGIMMMFCAVWTVVCGAVLFAPAWLLAVDWTSGVPHALAALGVLSGWLSAFGASPVTAQAAGGAAKPGAGQTVAAIVIKAAPAVFLVILAIALSIATNIFLTAVQSLPEPATNAMKDPAKTVQSLPNMATCAVKNVAHAVHLSPDKATCAKKTVVDADPAQPWWYEVRKPDAAGKTSAVPWHEHQLVLERTHFALALVLTAVLFFLGWFMGLFINVNTFSLHGMYRDRLVRAYLGASNARSKANVFTGFAKDDDIAMHELLRKPFHVVNVTLNLVAANRLAWQQRKAQSFTISPLHCGSSAKLGYRPSALYGGDKGIRLGVAVANQGISLGTAIAISGAAASPSMGYHSSSVVGFIMTLLNARLGAWLGNPGDAGRNTWKLAGPRSAIRSLVSEAFGLTSNQHPYVYLSDGGHFENLGLFEMVLRRCRFILVLDAGCDAEFSYDDLGNAVRKIRIDHGIPIEFDEALIKPMREKQKRCAMARIRYSAVDGNAIEDDGWLIYVKPMCIDKEPPDVDTYRRSHPAFPHQSTNNQWFDESQTESYRMLGLTTIEDICGHWKDGSPEETDGSLEDFFRHIETTYLRASIENKASAAPPEAPANPHAAEPSRRI